MTTAPDARNRDVGSAFSELSQSGPATGGARARALPILQQAALGMTGGAALIFAFDLFTRVSGVSEAYLPHALSVLDRLAKLLIDPSFLLDALSTMFAWLLGLAMAIILGVSFGAAMGLSRTAYRIGLPIVNLMRPIPSVCIIPLAILVMGQGLSMKVLLVSYAAVWPILINTLYGIHGTDPVANDMARCFGLPRTAILYRIVLPAAAPMIFTGIRISASIGLVVLVSTELLAATSSGLGSFIFRMSSSGGNMDAVIAGAVFAGIIGVAINASLGVIDQRWFTWRRQQERA